MTKHVRKRTRNGTHHSVLDSSPTSVRESIIMYSPLRNENFTDFPVELILLQSTFILHFLFCIIRYRNVLYTRDLLIKMKSRKKCCAPIKRKYSSYGVLTRWFYFFYMLLWSAFTGKRKTCSVPCYPEAKNMANAVDVISNKLYWNWNLFIQLSYFIWFQRVLQWIK